MRAKYHQLIGLLRRLFSADRFISSSDMSMLCAPFLDYKYNLLQRLHIRHFFHRRNNHNRRFIKRSIRQKMFCNNCQLDAQQIEAVVACEDAQLVLASAGSGKTLSLLAKIEYLHRQLKIPAEQILVISFTQKTVLELKERCTIKNVEIRTFHSLGNSLLQFATDTTLGRKKLVN